MLSSKILPGKRAHEIVILELLLKQEQVNVDEYRLALKHANCRVDEATLLSVERVLNLSFYIQSQRGKYGSKPICILEDGRDFALHKDIRISLRDNGFRESIQDIIKCAKEKSREYDHRAALALYQKYTRKEVCKLLNWHSDESSTVGGQLGIGSYKNSDVPVQVKGLTKIIAIAATGTGFSSKAIKEGHTLWSWGIGGVGDGTSSYRTTPVMIKSYNSQILQKWDTIKVNVNGDELSFEQSPVLINNQTMVPLRKIFEALGANVVWD